MSNANNSANNDANNHADNNADQNADVDNYLSKMSLAGIAQVTVRSQLDMDGISLVRVAPRDTRIHPVPDLD